MTEKPGFQTLLILTSRAMAKRVSDVLKPHGLAPAQLAVLELLEAEGQLYPGTLARRLEVETSTMTKTLDRLKRDGLVERERDTKDRRGVIIRITDKARGLVKPARESVRRVEEEALASLDPETRAVVNDALWEALKALRTDT